MSSLFVSYRDLNLELVLKMIMEHCPGWIIDGSRKQWILYAIRTKDLAFLRILAQTVRPFINTFEYLELAVGIDDNRPVIEYLMSLNCPVDQLKVLTSAVEKKALKNLEFLHEKMEFPVDNYNLFSSAAGTEDNIEIMEYLMSHKCPINHFFTSESAALNNLKWLLKNGILKMNEEMFYSAVSSGSLEMLKWLKAKNCCPIYKGTLYSSLGNCSIETLEWLIVEQGFELNPEYVFRQAAQHGGTDKMKRLLKNNYSIEDTWLFFSAAGYESLEILEWLLENGCIRVEASENLAAAARQGHFEVMKWLLKNNCWIIDSEILVAAAEFGSIRQMEWLLDNKCPIDDNPYILEEAAEKGNVELMKFLINKRCPTDLAMRGAAKHGCLTIMMWLLEEGCRIDDPEIMIEAVLFGSLRNMKWLFKKGCAIDNHEIFELAAEQGSSLDIMKWLLDNGCPIGNSVIFVRATVHGSLVNMKWLLDNGCPIDHSHIMKAAATYGSLVNMKWLLDNGCPMNDPEIFFEAVWHGSLRNLKWLLENKCPVDKSGTSKAIKIFGAFEKLLQLLELDPSVVIYQQQS